MSSNVGFRNKIIQGFKGEVKYAHLNLKATGSSYQVLGKERGLVGEKREVTKSHTDVPWSFLGAGREM